MPGKIKSKKQLKFMYNAAEQGAKGLSKSTAKRMIGDESKSTKSRLMRS